MAQQNYKAEKIAFIASSIFTRNLKKIAENSRF
jgi:hypothetical protein